MNKRLYILGMVTFLAVHGGFAKNLLENGDLAKGGTGFSCSVNLAGPHPWREDLGVMEITKDLHGRCMKVDFNKAVGMKVGIVKVTIPTLKEGTEYDFSFMARSAPNSSVITIVPQPDSTGKLSGGKPAGISSWFETYSSWIFIQTSFVHTPGVNDDCIKLFFDNTKATETFYFKDFVLTELKP